MLRHLTLLCLFFLFHAPFVSAQFNYAPNRVHIPDLRKRYDGDIILHFGFADWLKSTEVQASFSPVGRWFLAGHLLTSGRVPVSVYERGCRYRFGEAAAGYYTPFSHGSFTLSGGVARGHILNSFENDYSSNLSFVRYFAQAGIFSKKDIWSFGSALRAVHLDYTGGGISFDLNDDSALSRFLTIDRTTPYFFPELCVQAGISFWKLEVQTNITLVLARYRDLGFTQSNAGLSLMIDFSAFGASAKKSAH